MQTIVESTCTYDIASSNSGYFLANESTIRVLADAMGASVHIGTGTGNITCYNGYTAPIEGTPFVEIGDFYFTIMYRTSNYNKYLCLYNKNYGAINYNLFHTGTGNYILGHSDKYNIKYIASGSDAYIFCEYENIDGAVTHCAVQKGTSTIVIYHNPSGSTTINIPTYTTTSTVDYICIQELAYHMRLAVFRGLYSALIQYSSGYKTIQLNGETYEVLSGSPAFCIKMS